MKSVLISLSLVISFATQAQAADAPLFGLLNMDSISGNMASINPNFGRISGAQLSFDSQSIELTLNKTMPDCAEGMLCMQVIPAPLQISLPIVNIVQNACSVVYTAASATEQIVVEDFSNTLCRIMMPGRAVVSYSATAISATTGQTEIATAEFFLLGEFSTGTEGAGQIRTDM